MRTEAALFYEKGLLSYDLPTEFFKWCEIAADRSQWRAVCGLKCQAQLKEIPTSPREDIWAELRCGTIPEEVQALKTIQNS
jgi:hypothetical protein